MFCFLINLLVSKNIRVLTFVIAVGISTSLNAQSSVSYAVRLSASIQTNPPSITLQWPSDPAATTYRIYKKTKESSFWGLPLAVLPDSITLYKDDSVEIGKAYEYKIWESATNHNGYGYIYAGIEVPAIERRGTIILIVDDTYSLPLASELARLQDDMQGAGWQVIRNDMARNDAVTKVKAFIVDQYTTAQNNIKAVFLFGHVPVPYSGNIAPDGHANHVGAWPADVYYGDMNGVWTDVSVNSTTAARAENRNIPFDGKFDQNAIPSNLELQVGRVDLYNLPSFSESDTMLLKQYLDKDHAFRHKMFTAERRALIDDNFGGFGGEAFASTGWRNFSTMFGDANVTALDYFSNLDSTSYLWSYGCGGGTYTSASGVGNTGQFAANTVQTVFTVLFGSYFGDWDSQNNFLRAALASKTHCLTNFWAGRPHWSFHHMALGENIGYSTRLTQNNSFLYTANLFSRYIHIALMGDPTLEMHIVGPPYSLNTDSIGFVPQIKLNWTASNDSVLGYYVYRWADFPGTYVRLTPDIITDTTHVDSNPFDGANMYLVRAVKLEQTASGSYFNLSQGIFDTIVIDYTGVETRTIENRNLSIYPSPTNGLFMLNYTDIGDNKEEVRISVFDLKGKLIYFDQVYLRNGKISREIDLRNKARGIYIVEVKNGFKSLVSKVVLD